MEKSKKKGILHWKAEDKNLSLKLKKKKTKIFDEKLLSAIPINNHLIIQTEGNLKEEIARLN
jgi:hypothetical protein